MDFLGTMKIRSARKIADNSMVSIGFECLDREVFDPKRCYELLGRSGVKYARVQTGWVRCEREKGVFDFTWLDEIVDQLLAHGVLPWFNVGFGNPLYMPDLPNPTGVGCVPLYYGEETLAAWKRFSGKLAEHYRGRVSDYEIWNEPDIEHFWYPGEPDGTQYARLVALTGACIRAENADARIGACISSEDEFDFLYLEALAKGLKPGELDFFSLHRYTVFPENGWMQRVQGTRRTFERYGHDLHYWMGEGGYPSWFPKNHWMKPRPENAGSEHQQAVYQLRRYIQDAALGLERSSYFQMVDMWQKPYQKASEVLDRPAAQGVLNGITYTPKKAYETIGRLANLLCSVKPMETYWEGELDGATRCEQVSIQTFALRKGSQPVYVYYLPTDIQDECAGRTNYAMRVRPLEENVQKMERPVWVDLYSGGVFAVKAEEKDGCQWFYHLPIEEYPVMLCDESLIEIERDSKN